VFEISKLFSIDASLLKPNWLTNHATGQQVGETNAVYTCQFLLQVELSLYQCIKLALFSLYSLAPFFFLMGLC